MNDQENILTVVERCPQCGGRVSAARVEAGFEFICIGMVTEEIPCGWRAESSREAGRVVAVQVRPSA